jgi:hypothetical protein
MTNHVECRDGFWLKCHVIIGSLSSVHKIWLCSCIDKRVSDKQASCWVHVHVQRGLQIIEKKCVYFRQNVYVVFTSLF